MFKQFNFLVREWIAFKFLGISLFFMPKETIRSWTRELLIRVDEENLVL